MDQDVPQHVQAELIKKSNSLKKEATEIDAKIDMELFEDIKDVSSKETIVSDGNDTDSSFGDIDGENEVKILFLEFYFNIR